MINYDYICYMYQYPLQKIQVAENQCFGSEVLVLVAAEASDVSSVGLLFSSSCKTWLSHLKVIPRLTISMGGRYLTTWATIIQQQIGSYGWLIETWIIRSIPCWIAMSTLPFKQSIGVLTLFTLLYVPSKRGKLFHKHFQWIKQATPTSNTL